jgi:hypothetical protein
VRRRPILALAVAASFVLAGCNSVPEGAIEAAAFECEAGTPGCDDVLPVGPGGPIEIEMGDFFFTVTDGAPVTGEVEVTVINVSDQYHNAEFLGAAEGSAIPEADGREEGTDTVLLFPGEWTVICNVTGHRALGMETTITVYATEEEAQAAIEANETDADRDAATTQDM